MIAPFFIRSGAFYCYKQQFKVSFLKKNKIVHDFWVMLESWLLWFIGIFLFAPKYLYVNIISVCQITFTDTFQWPRPSTFITSINFSL